MNLVDELRAICRVLEEAGVTYAVCGGVAVTIHGAPRSTKDIDILVEPEAIDRCLEEGEYLVVDFLLARAAFAGTLEDRVRCDLPDGPLTVVSRATLLRMKRLARRHQDLADVEKLEEVAAEAEAQGEAPR